MRYIVDTGAQSKRLIGAVIMLLSTVASGFGIYVAEEMQEQLIFSVYAITSAITMILNIWSKIREKEKLK
jgi:hypothetical protein